MPTRSPWGRLTRTLDTGRGYRLALPVPDDDPTRETGGVTGLSDHL